LIPNNIAKKVLSLSSTDSNFAYENKNIVLIAVETNFILENMDLMDGNSTSTIDTTFMFSHNLKMRYLIMWNQNIYEHLKRWSYT